MGLSKEEIERIALLARLEMTDETSAKTSTQLSAILDYIAKLNELDTSGVEPLSHPAAITGAFRDDAPTGSLPRDKALQNAPDQADGCFRVPRVIE